MLFLLLHCHNYHMITFRALSQLYPWWPHCHNCYHGDCSVAIVAKGDISPELLNTYIIV